MCSLSALGQARISRAITENAQLNQVAQEFHQDLVAYANSKGGNQEAFQRMTMKSVMVENALGWDNLVSGVQIGMYMMNNARLLPLAIQEMRREYGDGPDWRDKGGQIADVVQTVLFRHMGRRAERDRTLKTQSGRFWSCVATGWSVLTALPISVLEAFGLLNSSRASAAKQSSLFKLWNLLLATAAFLGPVFAYLADRDKIEAAISTLFP